jgi:Do/DeqQ family serine protease
VVAGLLLGMLAMTCTQPRSQQTSNAIKDAHAAPAQLAPAPAFANGKASIADVAKRVVPSVVNISATKVVRGHQSPMMQDPMFREFFGHRGMPQERRAKGLGSGVIVSADGVVLTNNHVIDGAEEITVALADGRELEAKLVGTDPKSDVAVIKIQGEPKNLQPIAIGSSASLRLGDVVLAVGNPFGVGQTVTMGIVSAKGRSAMGITDYEDFIQTDAAINPGNSGGALVNMRGELVGINTAILSRTGGYQGIGFAIPTDMARPIMDSLLEYGEVKRGKLGVAIQQLDDDLAEAMNLSVRKGVLISDVEKGSAADQAGLRRGDVVVELNGRTIEKMSVFRNRIAALGPGGKATMAVIRDGKRTEVTATLGALASKKKLAADDKATTEGLLSGLEVSDMNDAIRSKYRIADGVGHGVVVTSVDPRSPAAGAGIRPGDVIQELNRKPIDSVAALEKTYDPSKRSVLLLVNRGGATLYIALRG